ncbi:MAG: hypothetical protein LBR36_04265 [Bacteroidales bacterium]|jgi:transcriptional regulator with XRE-family HTH domain|nr:hypothetical protein [Bacteroidales bacterium]
MKIAEINIGEEIKKIAKDRLGTYTAFAEKMGIHKSHLNVTIFNKTHLDSNMLRKVSEVLEYNFFQLYVDSSPEEEVMENNENLKVHATFEADFTFEELRKMLNIKQKK